MIDLTPLEVRQKKGDFRRSFRGYDPELVNDFLDLVADRMEELVKQNMGLGDRVEALEDELEDYRQKEQALSEALMTAQKLREDARGHAEKEGELLVREARMAAEAARQEASASLAREEETLRQVRARRQQLVTSFRRMLERELGELDVIEETLELEGPAASAGLGSPNAERSPAEPPEPSEASPAESRPEPSVEAREAPSAAEAGVELSPEHGRDEVPATEEEDDEQEDWLKSLAEE